MNRPSVRGAAAIALLTLAIAGCQNQGGGGSVDAVDGLESIDASSPSMDGAMPSGSMDMGSEEPSPSGS
jgi:hypothetical protein